MRPDSFAPVDAGSDAPSADDAAIWSSTAIVLTYSRAGGFYDHVPPPPACPPTDLAAAPIDAAHASTCASRM